MAACPQCGSLFASNTKFKDHLIRQDTQKTTRYSCSICYHTYPSERLLREHVRRHINTLKCPFCDLTCNGPSRLQHHIHFRHNSDTPEQCPVCQKRFKTGHCLSEHLETHAQKTFQCSITGCKYIGKTLKAWQSHMKKIHMPDRKDYCCHICGECFLGGMKLSVHLKTIHGFQLPPGHSRFRYICNKIKIMFQFLYEVNLNLTCPMESCHKRHNNQPILCLEKGLNRNELFSEFFFDFSKHNSITKHMKLCKDI